MTRPEPSNKKWLNAAEAAELLGVPRSTLYAYIRDERVPFTRLSPRVIRFDQSELASWLEARHVSPS